MSSSDCEGAVSAYQTCRICGNRGDHDRYVGVEMMYGTREKFPYFICASCGCLQIEDFPENLHKYYPVDYYSHSRAPSRRYGLLKRLLIKQRVRNALFDRGYKLNKVISGFVDMPDIRVKSGIPLIRILRTCGVEDFSTRFLDVGCGVWSDWLADLRDIGFCNLSGIDPFVSQDVFDGTISIRKLGIAEVAGEYDVISFHHSLEHIPDQLGALKCAARLLVDGGVILIRIPTVSSQVWDEYKTNWVEMDAPRHLYLHSDKSLAVLADRAGLEISEKLCDSTSFEFYASEQYARGIPLRSSKSFEVDRGNGLFSVAELGEFRRKAEAANQRGKGGRACYFLRAAK